MNGCNDIIKINKYYIAIIMLGTLTTCEQEKIENSKNGNNTKYTST